jgi:hypothetical protein
MTATLAGQADLAPLANPFPPGGLPLTPLERLLVDFIGPANPMVIRVLLRFHGPTDLARLHESFRNAVSRHPLLRSHLTGTGSKSRWILSEQPLELIESTVADFDRPISALPPREACGLSARFVVDSSMLNVCLDFQHACCDAAGARHFITDWFTSYDELVHEQPSSLPVLNQDLLSRRAEIAPPRPHHKVDFRQAVRNFYVTIRGRTARLRRTSPNESGSLLAVRWLTGEETSRLHEKLRSRLITINDLGIAACMAAFCEAFPATPSKHFITVSNPADRRVIADRLLPAANRWGLAFPRRRVGDCGDFESLLSGIHDEMRYVKSHNVADEFLKSLATAAKIPSAIQLLQRVGAFCPTMQFTCLGEQTRTNARPFRKRQGVTVVGHLEVESITPFAPNVPGVPLSVCFSESDSRLCITTNGHPAFVTQPEIEPFTETLRRFVLDWAAT